MRVFCQTRTLFFVRSSEPTNHTSDRGLADDEAILGSQVLAAPLFLAVTAASMLICAWLAQRERYLRQRRICEGLIHSLGGDRPIEVDLALGPVRVGHLYPEGLEFQLEMSNSWTAAFYPGGLPEVTVVSIACPSRRGFDRKQWRETTLREIVKLTSLRTVSVGSDIIDDDDVGRLKELPELTTLLLSAERMTDAALRDVGQMRKLEELHVTANAAGSTEIELRASDRGLRYLSNLTGLRALGLTNVAVHDDIFSPLQCLRAVNFYGCDVPPKVFLGLARCRQLESFGLQSEARFSQAEAACLATLPHLRNVGICAEMSDDSLLALCASRSICEISLWRCGQLTERGFARLSALPLERFNLWNTGWDERVFEYLAGIKSLSYVGVEIGAVSDDQLANIARMTGLDEILLINGTAPGPILSDEQFAWLTAGSRTRISTTARASGARSARRLHRSRPTTRQAKAPMSPATRAHRNLRCRKFPSACPHKFADQIARSARTRRHSIESLRRSNCDRLRTGRSCSIGPSDRARGHSLHPCRPDHRPDLALHARRVHRRREPRDLRRDL